MKRVVIVGPDFVPSSYPPALRIRLFAQHLPEFGWQPTVVTTKPRYYEWAVDPENERLLPAAVEVIRTPALPARLTRTLGIGDIGIRSLWYHWREVRALCRRSRVDVLLIPVPPHIPAVLGRLIYDAFGVPYVIDYIDPWVSTLYRRFPRTERPRKRSLSYALSRVLEPFALRHVGHVVGVSKGTTDGVIARYPWLTAADTTEIPYGGEPADFEYVRRHPRRNKIFDRNDGLLHISYVGRGGPDMAPALRAVFEAVGLGLKRAQEKFRRLRLHFVGTTYDPRADGLYLVRPLAETAGLGEYVEEHPRRVSYLDALQILLDSHVLLVPGSDAPHYTASKIFPYILARRPLLAVFHEASSVVRILKETRAGDVVTFSAERPPTTQVEEIAKRLEAILLLPPGFEPATRWEAFEPYTASSMAGRLTQAFEKALLKRSLPALG